MARREIEIPLSRFGVLVAQLESIVASAHQQSPDALLCFDLLSELVSAIEEEPKEAILQWQRKCEDALHSLLVLGARRPVRRLASMAMGKVIAKGDGISIYSRASSLQGWLADGKRSEPHSCAGAAQCLGELYRLFGRRITSGLLETMHIAAKLMRFNEDFVRKDALQMLANALDGSGGNGASTAYLEAFRIIMRVGVSDKSFIVKLAAAGCLKTFASIGGPGLGISELESSIAYCLKALEDPVSAIRDAFSEALGALLALAMNPESQVRHRVKAHTLPAKKLDDGLVKHLILPFNKASGVRAKEMRIGLALSFVFFLQVVRLKYGASDSDLQNFAFQAIDMLQGNAYEDSHALACVLYILCVGVADQMTEPTQRIFLVLLGKKLGSADYSPSVGVVILRILSYLLTTLGEVPLEFKEVLDDTIVAALSHSSLHVRIEAALTLRALAEVDPTCVGGLISYGVTTLHALRETLSPEKGSHLHPDLDSLHGQATILAALVSISPRLLLGYPARLPKLVFEVSKKMLIEYSRNSVVATVEREAGWLLLASLLASLPKEELEDQVFDVLLLWAGPLLGSEFHIRQTQDLTSEIRVLSAAMEALTAFIRSFVHTTAVGTNGGILLQPVLAYLSGALSYISILSSKQMQSMIRPALDLFTTRTILAYESLSNPMAYKSEHPQLLQICTSPFASDASRYGESSCLRFLLDKRDACLGPWIPGRDWFEDELRAFDGCKDGIVPCVWDYQLSSFPQLESVSKMLVNQILLFFGTIFASQDSGGKLVLLNMIDQCLKIGKKQPWRRASITNACVGLLSGLKAALALRSQGWEIEILTSIQSIFQGILLEGEISSEQRRASAEGLGLLTRLGNDVFTAKMARSLLGELIVATDPNFIESIALSLGCIHRSAGGMALSTLVPTTVTSISNLAKSSNPGLQLWPLHALLLTIEAAGLSYVSQVQATLFLAIEILLSEENGLVDLREEIGRLINAIVAVLGPELAPGSTFFSRCKSVIAEISSCQETSTLLESVRFTQQLVLFAPQAVSVHSHVQSLLPTLFSKQPSLRHLAASTLRHLIEKDPVAIIDEKIEENLFIMLDEETDTEIGNLVRATIIRLLYASCPSVPYRWLTILNGLVLATSIRRNTSEKFTTREKDHMNSSSEGDSRLDFGEDDENMITSSTREQMQESGSVSNANLKRVEHLRYRTRIFAAECLSHVPTAVGTEPAHFDLALARQLSKAHAGSGDFLVLHLQELISLSYQISTGQIEGMQHIGVGLLCIIMDKYDHLPDPELPGHLLMEQYQAQLVSAVRSAISPSSGPLLLEAGLQLATKILTSSIVSGDRVALNRMFSLISRPLDEIKDLYYPSFAEWVACKIKVRLLAAHASIKCYVYSFLKEQKEIPDEYLPLVPLFSSKSGILGKYWTDALKDYCYICFSLQSNLKYKPFLDGIQSSVVSSKVKGCLDEAWPAILEATVLDSVPSKFELEAFSKSAVEDPSREMFASGCSMVKLEFGEVQFLWGLALLVLFQGQQLELEKQVKMPLVNIDKEYDQGYSVKESHLLTYSEIALVVFQSLSKEYFLSQGFLSVDLCREIFQLNIVMVHTFTGI
ncbi:Armadillo-like helical-containing protein [Dioscorea alata]|uniref:Armadillo-like helical-containing protein n=1 Tax=Dioscorea alata TaxID=55571 RepID=A0ACB7UDF3_DIOAL|nr:Armadillo-like helical-containing protein [Dioscorea alata]